MKQEFLIIHTQWVRMSKKKGTDRIFMERDGAYIRILNPEHQWVGSLSRKGVEKWKDRLPGIINAQVLGVIIRNAGENDLPMKTKTGIEQ